MARATEAHYAIFCLEHTPDEPNTRLLDTTKYPPAIEVKVAGEPWTYLTCPRLPAPKQQQTDIPPIAHNDSLVIAIDGSWRHARAPSARGAIGVFVHAASKLNVSRETFEPLYAPTNQRVRLHAAIAALELAQQVKCRNSRPGQPDGPFRRLRRLVLKTDTRGVIDVVLDVERWDGCVLPFLPSIDCQSVRCALFVALADPCDRSRSARRHSANSDLIDRLMAAIQELEGSGVRVQFWLVSKLNSEEACRLAKDALAEPEREMSTTAASGGDRLNAAGY